MRGNNKSSNGATIFSLIVIILCAIILFALSQAPSPDSNTANNAQDSSTSIEQGNDNDNSSDRGLSNLEIPTLQGSEIPTTSGNSGASASASTPTHSETPETSVKKRTRRQTPERSNEGNGQIITLPVSKGGKVENAGLKPGTEIAVVSSVQGDTVNFDGCTVAFSLPGKSGMPWAITAGHCGYEGAKVYTYPRGKNFSEAQFLGTVRKVSISSTSNNTSDWSAIRLFTKAQQPEVDADIPSAVNTFSMREGEKLCKYGSTTKETCGEATRNGVEVNMSDSYGGGTVTGTLSEAKMCAEQGDSGGPVYDNDGVVGVVVSSHAGNGNKCNGDDRMYYIPMKKVLDEIYSNLDDVVRPVAS